MYTQPLAIEEERVTTDKTERDAGPRTTGFVDVAINVLLVACLAMCLWAGAASKLWPGVYAAQPQWNFGSVAAGTPVQHTFSVRNPHPWPMQVTGVASDCGCTRSFVGRTPPFTLRPLQSVDVAPN